MIELPLPVRRYYERKYMQGEYVVIEDNPLTLEQVLYYVATLPNSATTVPDLKWEINYNR